MKLRRAVVVGICLTSGLLAAQTAKPPAAESGAAKPEAKAEATPAAAAPAPAAAAAAPSGVRSDSPCKEDVELLCPGVQPGEGRIYRCLAEKEQEVSNNCKARLADLRATGGECKEDIQKFCASVPHTRGKLAQCLAGHHDELSGGCKALSSRAKEGLASAIPAAAPSVAASSPAAPPPAATAAPAAAAPPKASGAASPPAADAGAR